MSELHNWLAPGAHLQTSEHPFGDEIPQPIDPTHPDVMTVASLPDKLVYARGFMSQLEATLHLSDQNATLQVLGRSGITVPEVEHRAAPLPEGSTEQLTVYSVVDKFAGQNLASLDAASPERPSEGQLEGLMTGLFRYCDHAEAHRDELRVQPQLEDFGYSAEGIYLQRLNFERHIRHPRMRGTELGTALSVLLHGLETRFGTALPQAREALKHRTGIDIQHFEHDENASDYQ